MLVHRMTVPDNTRQQVARRRLNSQIWMHSRRSIRQPRASTSPPVPIQYSAIQQTNPVSECHKSTHAFAINRTGIGGENLSSNYRRERPDNTDIHNGQHEARKDSNTTSMDRQIWGNPNRFYLLYNTRLLLPPRLPSSLSPRRNCSCRH